MCTCADLAVCACADLLLFHAAAQSPSYSTPLQHSYPGSHGIPQSASFSSAISHYHTYLKYVYGNSPISPNTKWPPTPGREFITLAVVEGRSCRDKYIGHTLHGSVKKVLHSRKEISIEQILEPVKGQNKPRLVLIEGAPGIGKSTLAWELCRKWEELSCMQQYSLVVLLRLREEKVQQISEVSHLFICYESKHKKSLVEGVSEGQGSGVLFILDGFDELPKTLQKEGFLLDLIKGSVLPASTVLVTSRPSASAELLSCSPKHIEIIGFTQESVKAYASSIFSSEPEKLKKFLDSISASENPAINSLMYVPLNAAIIVRIYLDCKSDALLPHTLTELYTLLCLTILNRDIMTRNPRVKKIRDLSGDMHDQFLELSKIAFEGILNEEVVFNNVPDDFVHFGFLDAVSALYGGGGVSYNFLHLTLQEFFAAYYISHLGSSGLKAFKQHGKDKRWNVVWRFVAGLTKFEHYKGHMDSDLFIVSRKDRETKISLFTIQCLFEAQSVDHFSPIFSTSQHAATYTKARVDAVVCTALDTYALGFCISNFHTGVSWSVYMNNHSAPFACGLKRKTPSVGVIRELTMESCPCNLGELSTALLPPHLLTSLRLFDFFITNADLIHLSELIPHMICLKKLDISTSFSFNSDGDHDGLLKILQQFSSSKVTTLNITNTGFCELLRDSPHDSYSALKELCPSSGKLEELLVGDNDDDDDSRLASLVSAPSSLKSLELWYTSLSGHVSYLKNNTMPCLTKLTLACNLYYDWSGQAPHIAQILEHNKTLQHLEVKWLSKYDIDSVRTIVRALPENNTLQSIELYIGDVGDGDDAVSRYMKTHHEELTLDPRIHYKQL